MDGKVIVGTGASGALGRVVAISALAMGARVAGVDHAASQVAAAPNRIEFGGVDLTEDRVDDAMSVDAYAVPPDAPLAEVSTHMAANRYGCAVVIERGRVIGIFTTTDALRALGVLAP